MRPATFASQPLGDSMASCCRWVMAYQRVYGATELLAEVRTGDAVLIPRGWHGPSMAVPGYDLYYLNVMAGPGERAWLICDDPAHGWFRATWEGQAVDPRLPLGGNR